MPREAQDALRDELLPLLALAPREYGRELRGHMLGTWATTFHRYRLLYRIEGAREQDVILDSVLFRPDGYPRHAARRPRAR